jgi:PAS domain S-box-containing protein
MATGRFRRANAAFCALVGYSEAELQRLTYAEITHPEDRGRDAVKFAALQQGEVQKGSSLTRLLPKDGGVVWAELHVTVLEGAAGNAVNLTVVNDVTERKRAEAALRDSEDPRRQRRNATARWTLPRRANRSHTLGGVPRHRGRAGR